MKNICDHPEDKINSGVLSALRTGRTKERVHAVTKWARSLCNGPDPLISTVKELRRQVKALKLQVNRREAALARKTKHTIQKDVT